MSNVIDLFTREEISLPVEKSAGSSTLKEKLEKRLKSRGLSDLLPLPKLRTQKLADGHTLVKTYKGCIHSWRSPKHRGKKLPMPIAYDPDSVEKVIERSSIIKFTSEHDAFQWMDLKYGATKHALECAVKHNTQVIIETKSDLIAHDNYLPILKRLGFRVKVIIDVGSDDDHQERVDFPGAPSINRRLEAYETLREAGIPVDRKVNRKIKQA